jgi:hypothetical protein
MMPPPPRSSTTLYSQQQHEAQDEFVVEEEATEANMTTTTTTRAKTPLSEIVEAFEELAKSLNSRRIRNSDKGAGGELRLDAFSKTCSLVSVLFSCLGLAFRFAESEYVAKVLPFSFISLLKSSVSFFFFLYFLKIFTLLTLIFLPDT